MFTDIDKTEINNKISKINSESNRLMKTIEDFSILLEKDDNYQRFVLETQIGINIDEFLKSKIKDLENLYEINKKTIYMTTNVAEEQTSFNISL